jgi:hypothetical protein
MDLKRRVLLLLKRNSGSNLRLEEVAGGMDPSDKAPKLEGVAP